MKRSLVNDLYHGKLYPAEDVDLSGACYRDALHRESELSAKMQRLFLEEDWKMFEEYRMIDGEVQNYLLEATFLEGFRIGAYLVAELAEAEGR